MSRLRLRSRPGLHKGEGHSLVPPWVGPLFILCAVVLLPWTAYLFIALPDGYAANHWSVAWGGFDIGLGLALVITSFAIAKRHRFGEIAATITGTLLVCDAWFDILTSRGMSDVVQAIISAVVIELPLAFLCFWVAANVNRAVESVRPYLERAGFTIRDHKLVPPTDGGQPAEAEPEAVP
jgi:hypothetical protein